MSSFPMLQLVVDGQPTLQEWRQAIASEAQKAMVDQGISMDTKGPIAVTASFSLRRPLSIRDKDVPMTKSPTVTQLQTIVLDALENIVFKEQVQVVEAKVSKSYVPAGPRPFALIIVDEVSS